MSPQKIGGDISCPDEVQFLDVKVRDGQKQHELMAPSCLLFCEIILQKHFGRRGLFLNVLFK